MALVSLKEIPERGAKTAPTVHRGLEEVTLVVMTSGLSLKSCSQLVNAAHGRGLRCVAADGWRVHRKRPTFWCMPVQSIPQSTSRNSDPTRRVGSPLRSHFSPEVSSVFYKLIPIDEQRVGLNPRGEFSSHEVVVDRVRRRHNRFDPLSFQKFESVAPGLMGRTHSLLLTSSSQFVSALVGRGAHSCTQLKELGLSEMK